MLCSIGRGNTARDAIVFAGGKSPDELFSYAVIRRLVPEKRKTA
jgi:hypothetical protein